MDLLHFYITKDREISGTIPIKLSDKCISIPIPEEFSSEDIKKYKTFLGEMSEMSIHLLISESDDESESDSDTDDRLNVEGEGEDHIKV